MSEPPTPNPPPSRCAYRAYYGTGYAGADFRGIGSDLLKTFPPLAPPVPALPAIDPTAAGFGVHGPHLLAPLIDGAGGSRVSPCPVCRTTAVVSRTAGGWVPLRCESCGTEFVATDGTVPPPPPAPTDTPARTLELWVASGEPHRWVAYRRGEWGESELSGLLESLRLTRYWPLDPAEVRRILNEATEHYRNDAARRTPEPTTVSSFTAPFYTRADGRRVARCPVCAADVAVPTSAGDLVLAWCPFCGTEFVATDRAAPRPPAPAPKPAPSPPPPSPTPPAGVSIDSDGRWCVYCPHCWIAKMTIPKRPAPARMKRCPECRRSFVIPATMDWDKPNSLVQWCLYYLVLMPLIVGGMALLLWSIYN